MADLEKGIAFLDAQIARKPKVVSPKEYALALKRLWSEGLPSGDKTGWPSLDPYYTVVPGQLTVITGWPGAGKSEWLDALLVNLRRLAWKFVIFSPENHPGELHAAKLIEKIAVKPFGAGPTERITEDEIDEHLDELDASFAFIEAIDAGSLAVNDILEAAALKLEQFGEGKRGLVIDPWNELEHWRPSNLSETEYVSKVLSTIRNWGRRHKVHVFIVAHPQKIRREDGKLPVPTPDMISGSQNWWNKCDCAITIWRDLAAPDSRETAIHVQKVRFKHVGRAGCVTLQYDRVTGRYNEKLKSVARYGDDE